MIPGAGHTMRELLFLIRNEAVEHLDDLLLRRTTLAISGTPRRRSRRCARTADGGEGVVRGAPPEWSGTGAWRSCETGTVVGRESPAARMPPPLAKAVAAS